MPNCAGADTVGPTGNLFEIPKKHWINYCSCFTLNSAAKRTGLIICVNKRDASPLFIHRQTVPLSAFTPVTPPIITDSSSFSSSDMTKWSPALPESHPSRTDSPDHSRSRYETRGKICHDSLSTWNSFFRSQKGKCEASLSGKCDLSTRLLLSGGQRAYRSGQAHN